MSEPQNPENGTPRVSLRRAIFSLTLLFCLFWLFVTPLLMLLPGVGGGPVPPRGICRSNLRQIGDALRQYHETYGSYPPAITCDDQGNRLHSWRTLLLPYLDQEPLYRKIRLEEPWNSQYNRQFHDVDITYLALGCPAEHEDEPGPWTSYFCVIGPRTMWHLDRTLDASEIRDESSNVIMLVEAANSSVHWMEPRDLHWAQMAREINPASGQGISSMHAGANVLLLDGTVRFLPDELDSTELEELLLIDTRAQADGSPPGS